MSVWFAAKRRKGKDYRQDSQVPHIPVAGQNRTCPMKGELVIVDVADKGTSAWVQLRFLNCDTTGVFMYSWVFVAQFPWGICAETAQPGRVYRVVSKYKWHTLSEVMPKNNRECWNVRDVAICKDNILKRRRQKSACNWAGFCVYCVKHRVSTDSLHMACAVIIDKRAETR